MKLFVFARWQLTLARPYVITIIGTSNRTLVKEIVTDVLRKETTVQANEPQWNAEIGIPLTVLRTNVASHSVVGWLITLWKAWFKIFIGKYPKVVVLEVAFNSKGDMAYMSRMLKPNAVVLNDMQPLDGRFFVNEKDALVKEYFAMIKQGGKDDVVVINSTLPEKERVVKATKRTVIEYSVDGDAAYNATMGSGDVIVTTPSGKELFQSNIPGDAAKAAYAIAVILKDRIK